MKVLVVSSSFFPKIDGSTRCVYDHARKLAERGNEVYLATRGIRGEPRAEVLDGIRVRRSSVSFRSSSLPNKVALILNLMLSVLLLQRRHRFEVIHVHGYVSGLAALPSKVLLGAPVVITTHGTEFLWPRDVWWRSLAQLKLELIFERFVLANCNLVIAQSEGVREYMLKLYGDSFYKRIRIVPTGVDEKKFRNPAKRLPTRRILFVGALSEIKGVSCLIEAFTQVHAAFSDAMLELVGSGPAASRYKERVRDLGLDRAVVFTGPIRDDARLISLYDESDVVVLPSNVGGPISCTVLEGMSCGCAVISTDVPGGIPDVLGGGVGLLMKRGDSEQLAAMLTELMTDDKLLTRLQRAGRAAVEEKYTLDRMAETLESLYRGLAR